MRITDVRPQRAPRTLRRVAPLRYADRLRLPVGQQVSVPIGSADSVVEGILSAVKGGGFALVETTWGSLPATRASVGDGFSGGSLIAERKVRRVPTARSMRVSMAVLLAAGVGLGGLDMLIGGSVTYAVPWVAVAAVGTFLLWLRYGRTYESEVMAVSASVSAPTLDASSRPSAAVAWSVGRIRSVAFAGARAAVEVQDCPVSLMEALVRAVRQFQSKAD